MVLIRFGCALVSAFIFTIFSSRLVFMLWSIRCGDSWDANCHKEYEWFSNLTIYFLLFLASLWIATWAFFEILAYSQSRREKPRLLTHLRYGPIAVLVLSIAATLSYDLMMIQYSRWRIVQYIHSNAPPWEPPNLDLLHNNYRGFCGNGYVANKSALYRETAAAYLNDPDPSVRARALQASIHVNGLYVDVLRKAMADDDPLVREIAYEYWPELR